MASAGVRGGKGFDSDLCRSSTDGLPVFKIVPGREMVIVGIDAIVALMGIVYCGQDGYLVRRDSCFY